MDAADLVDGRARARPSPHLELLGLHAFGASNVLDAGALVAARRRDRHEPRAELALASRRAAAARGRRRRARHPVRAATRSRSTSSGSAAASRRSSPAGRRIPCSPTPACCSSPGRFLVGPAGAYLARVVDRKTVDGSIVVILDGGVHHVLRPALVGQEHRIAARSARRRPRPVVPVTVAGPLCSGLDVLAHGAVMAAAGGRRPRGRARCRRLRLHRIDAATSCRTRCRPRSSRATVEPRSSGRGLTPRRGWISR